MVVGRDDAVVFPARLQVRLIRVLDAARSTRRPQILEDLNVLLDAIDPAREEESRQSSASGTTIGGYSRLESAEILLSVSQAAARHRCSERAIRKALSEHRLVGTKVGKAWLIREQDLDQYRYGRK